jgi:hypothetical protein
MRTCGGDVSSFVDDAFRNIITKGIGLANILDQTKELFGTVFHRDYDHHVTAAYSQFGKTMIGLRFFRF